MSKILLSIPDSLLEAVDQYCGERHYERSELIRQAIRGMIYPKDILPKDETPLTSTIPVENTTLKYPETVGFCKLHWEPVRGKTYPIRVITWEDENGVAVVNKKEACPDCVKKYENMGRGRIYFLDG